MATTSEDVLELLRRRDPGTVRRVAEEHARPLYRAARALGFSVEDADELVQEVFVTFMATLDRFEGRSQIRTWLFGILHRKGLERRRDLADEARHESIDEVFEAQFDDRGRWRTVPPGPERLAASAELSAAIRDCLAAVTGLQRQAFVLREMQQLETPDICKILGCTVIHLGVLLHRARARMRGCLESKGWGSTS
jgi:RNA polymerase sigma-70 factor, ECF subfamily